MQTDIRNREARVRRLAARHELRLEKCRARTPEDPRWATYQLVDPYSNTLVSYRNGDGYGMSLEDVERELGDG